MVHYAPASHRNLRPIAGKPVPPRAAPLQRKIMLDEIDVRILSILQKDGRISKTALADAVSLSPSACLERMRRLEKKKIILSYHANVNLKVLLSHNTFFTEVTLRTHRANDFSVFENYIQKLENVVECYALGGGIDYLLKTVCPGVEHYQILLDRILESQIGVDRYFTYIVTKPVKYLPQLSVDHAIENSNVELHELK